MSKLDDLIIAAIAADKALGRDDGVEPDEGAERRDRKARDLVVDWIGQHYPAVLRDGGVILTDVGDLAYTTQIDNLHVAPTGAVIDLRTKKGR